MDSKEFICQVPSYGKMVASRQVRLGDNQNLELVCLGSHSELGL